MKKLLLISTAVILLCFLLSCKNQSSKVLLQELEHLADIETQNKALIVRYFEVIDKGDIEPIFSLIDELFAPDCVIQSAISKIRSHIRAKEEMEKLVSRFFDMHHFIHEIIAEGNIVAVRCAFEAVHWGRYLGVETNGQELSCPMFFFFRIENGKIIECLMDYDAIFKLGIQLGLEFRPKDEW